MDYTGAVEVGGPGDVRRLEKVLIAKLAVGSMNNNAYLVRCLATGEALLIDAAAEAGRLEEFMGTGGDLPSAVLTTHRHRDHWQALSAVIASTGATTLAGTEDADELPVPVHRRLSDGDSVRVGDLDLTIIGLRGHTPGSVAVLYEDPSGTPHLFTGDSLFPGGVGRTTSPAAFTSLIDDVERRVFGRLPDQTWVYPGHGADTTLGAERPQLGEWRERGW